MGKTKESNLALLDTVDVNKPVVKDFIDQDANIRSFILYRLPHVPNATASVKKVYQSKDQLIYRFRVNYHRSEHNEGHFVPDNHIVASRYVEVRCQGNEMELIEKN